MLGGSSSQNVSAPRGSLGLTPEEVFQVILREDLKAEQTTLAATNAAVEVPAPPDSNEQTAPVPAVQGQSNHECFTHYPDYREIRFQGQVYFPTSNQALIVKTLHEALKSGSPNVSADALLTQIGSSSSRLPDQFRGRNQSLWGTLIVKIPGSQDRYRLNIPPVSDPEKNL